MPQIHSSRFNVYCFPLLLVVLWSVIAQPAIAVDVTPSAELAALADRFIETRMDLNPLMATWITGEARYEDKFVNDLTPEFRAKERAMFAETLAALKKIDARNLAESDRLTRAARPVACGSHA